MVIGQKLGIVIPLALVRVLRQTGSDKDSSKAADIWIPAVDYSLSLIAGMTGLYSCIIN